VSAWIYDSTALLDGEALRHTLRAKTCRFCLARMCQIDDRYIMEFSVTNRLFVCPRCGWWRIVGAGFSTVMDEGGDPTLYVQAAVGALKNLDLNDITTPINEVRDYLAARYSERNRIHPRLFENVVASVFGSLGYKVRVTAYSGDDGIDVVLDNEDETIGVQVKRYKNAISVEQIRAFAGALLVNDLTKGIYVTTSHFQSGAQRTVNLFASRGYQVELVDALRFYDALEISRSPGIRSLQQLEQHTGPITSAVIAELDAEDPRFRGLGTSADAILDAHFAAYGT
jgi:restriction system protein